MKDSIRILLTEKCNANCKNCFNNEYRGDKEIPLSLVESLSSYLYDSGIRKVKIMGGEPTIHSSFVECVAIFQSLFDRVSLFTNALSENIYKINPRKTDCIVYNFNFIKTKNDIKKLLLDRSGYRALEIQVINTSDVVFITEFLRMLDKYSSQAKEKVGVNLTLDCTHIISDEQYMGTVAQNWNNLIDYLEGKSWHYNIDHNIPICIANKYGLPNNGVKKCSVKCSGLIDSALNLRFCNQNPKILLSLLDEEGFIPFKKICESLSSELIKKTEQNKLNHCYNCIRFEKSCNGGCFIHKAI